MKRGEIYYIDRRDTIGSEVMKARPGIIVSNDRLNASSTVVCVVYLTTSPKKEMPTHVVIEATGLTSTALCEQVDSVSTTLVGDFCGVCTAEEMNAVDEAMRVALGITGVGELTEMYAEVEKIQNQCIRAEAERDTYKSVLNQVLRQGVVGVVE